MSAISSTGGLAQLFQNLSANTSTSNGSGGTTTSTGSVQPTGRHGHRHGGGGGLDKLTNAITSALQSASNGSSGSIATDANQTITQALAKIFKNGSLGSTGDTDADNDASTPASNNATPAAPTTTASDGGLPASFVQTLKSFGVTPQQFQSDFAAALKTAQDSGTVDTSSVFKSFPVGSFVDSIG